MGARIEETGAGFLDAPLTRTPRETELGKANVMVGGDAAVLEQVRPILETFSENIYHAGPRGAGATLKLLHNFISLGNCVLLCEAVVSATKSNVDIDTFIEVRTPDTIQAWRNIWTYPPSLPTPFIKYSNAPGQKAWVIVQYPN